MPKKRMCPNCLTTAVKHHPENGCVLAALIQVLREREELPERTLLSLHAKTDVDALWDDLGPILDKLEDGGYLL